MEPRISIITLGVHDLMRSLIFYRDGLGLPTTWTGERGVVFFQTRGTCLALYPFADLAQDVGSGYQGCTPQKFNGIALAHNVRSRDEVDDVLLLAERAGGQIVKPADETSWGGYAGYFSDPDGYLWEVAFGGFDFHPDGSPKIS